MKNYDENPVKDENTLIFLSRCILVVTWSTPLLVYIVVKHVLHKMKNYDENPVKDENTLILFLSRCILVVTWSTPLLVYIVVKHVCMLSGVAKRDTWGTFTKRKG